METLANFQLIKRDVRALKKYIVYDDNINNWTKIIVIYNFYLFLNHLCGIFLLMNNLVKSNGDFKDEYKKIFMFFFYLCNLKNSYLYFILNVSKIDNNLANSFYSNTKKYFI